MIERYSNLSNKYFFYITKNVDCMKNSIVIIILSFLKEEIRIIISRIKFIYYFVKEFSISKFFYYLIDNSVIPSRDKIFRNYILKNSKKWKFKRNIINKNINKYVLVTNMVNHVGYAMTQIVVGKNLMEMLESNGIGLLRKYDLRSKLIFESFGVKKFIFLNDLNFFMRIKYFLMAYSIIKSYKTVDDFFEFELNGVNLGLAVVDHFLRFMSSGTINYFHPKFYLFLSQALSVHYQIKKNYDKFKFVACVQSERQFIPSSIIYQFLLTNGINVYTPTGSSNVFSVRKYSDTREIWKNRDRYSQKLYDQVCNSIKEKAVEIGRNNIEKRFIGIHEYEAFNFNYVERPSSLKKKKEKKTVNKKELCEKLEWDQNKSIVVIMASDFRDGIFDCAWRLFNDRLIWIRETLLEIKNIKNVNWLVKPHPNEEKYNIVLGTMPEYKKICSNYKHILPFPDNVTNESIPSFAHCLITVGSASYEYASLGIPAINTMESPCSGRGFTIDPGSKKEYFDLLYKIEKINKLNKDQIDKAKIHVYIESELTKINVNLITPFENGPMNDKTFWAKMIKLVDNYNEEKDLLKKMMKIQEINNDRHTINYDSLK